MKINDKKFHKMATEQTNTLCNIMARNTIISVAACDVVAAAPKAIPSAAEVETVLCRQSRKIRKKGKFFLPAACTTNPNVACNDLLFLILPLSGSIYKKIIYYF